MQNKDVQSEARLPALPVGNSDWAAVKSGYWSADKTQLFSGLLDKKSTVAIFTRPRRFGKTFAMNMLQAFFEKTEKSNAYLLKDAKGETWEETLRGICAAVRVEYKRHRPVFEASDCDEDALIVLINLRDVITNGLGDKRVQEAMWITKSILDTALGDGAAAAPRAAIVLSQADYSTCQEANRPLTVSRSRRFCGIISAEA